MAIYFIVSEGQNAVKIGKANNPVKRLRALQTASVHHLKLLGIVPGDLKAESKYHEMFEVARIRGEWFDLGRVQKIAADLNSQTLSALLNCHRRRATGDEVRYLIEKVKASTNRWLYRLRYSYLDPSSGKRKRSAPRSICYVSTKAEEVLRSRADRLRACLSQWYESRPLPFSNAAGVK